MFIELIFTNFKFYISWILIILVSVCFHEFCHAYVAYLNGDDTAKKQGYFSFNPMLQMGKKSLILLAILGICWGKCPVRQDNFKHEFSAAYVAAAGPLGNLLLSIIFALLSCGVYLIAKDNSILIYLYKILFTASVANVFLFIFNLIPVPPLDGHSIIIDLYPRAMLFYNKLGAYGFLIIIILASIPFIHEIMHNTSKYIAQFFFSLFLSLLKLVGI